MYGLWVNGGFHQGSKTGSQGQIVCSRVRYLCGACEWTVVGAVRVKPEIRLDAKGTEDSRNMWVLPRKLKATGGVFQREAIIASGKSNSKGYPNLLEPRWCRHESQVSDKWVCVCLILDCVFYLVLIKSFLAFLQALHFGMGTYTFCRCILEICNLFILLRFSGKRLSWVSEKTLTLGYINSVGIVRISGYTEFILYFKMEVYEPMITRS